VSTNRGRNSRFYVSLAIIFALGGIGLIAGGASYLSRQVSASIDPPPVPPAPSVTSTIVTPPIPPLPGSVEIPPLWSMIPSSSLRGANFNLILKTGVYIYSYNDPKFPADAWTVYSTENLDKVGGADGLKASNPLGYYVYNPTSKAITVSLQAGDTDAADEMIASGWHLLYWSGETPLPKSEFLGKTNFTYTDDKIISATDAVSETYHRVSPRIFVVMNEHTIDSAKALKELTDESTASTVNQIPARSYLWVYVRNSAAKLAKISFTQSTDTTISSQEKTKIDAYLLANNLNQCGDPPGTVYTGGSCLFNETTGKLTDKYDYLVKKFPNKPWNSL